MLLSQTRAACPLCRILLSHLTHIVTCAHDGCLYRCAACPQVLAHWLAALPADVFGGRVLRPLQRHISRCADRGLTNTRRAVLQAAQVSRLGPAPR